MKWVKKMAGRVALICGVSGQDGSYLAQFLLKKNYEVFGTSRNLEGLPFANHLALGIHGSINYLSLNPESIECVISILRETNPSEIYFLAGQSSVGLSFDHPIETIQSIVLGAMNILEACRRLDVGARIFLAGSSECFGDTEGVPAKESSIFSPLSPYGVAKASAYWIAQNYRENYGVFACTGILFNHESPLRSERFVTQKIVKAAKRIASGSKERLDLGRLDISRDWGWAPEYVEAMWLMLQKEEPEDFVIATGVSITLENFIEYAFECAGLEWRSYVDQNHDLFRTSDICTSIANVDNIQAKLGWKPTVTGLNVVKKMMNSN